MHGLRHEAVLRRSGRTEFTSQSRALALPQGLPPCFSCWRAFHAWHGLIPPLGIPDHRRTTGWALNRMRLSNYAGFIVNLLSASATGFRLRC